MNNILPIVASFTAGYLTVAAVRWSFGNVRSLLKNVTSASRMKLVVIVRSDLEMDRGKSALQCVQAAMSCYRKSMIDNTAVLKIWEAVGQPKIVLKSDKAGDDILIKYSQKAGSVGLVSAIVRNDKIVTAIGIGPGDSNDIDKIVGHLKLL